MYQSAFLQVKGEYLVAHDPSPHGLAYEGDLYIAEARGYGVCEVLKPPCIDLYTHFCRLFTSGF